MAIVELNWIVGEAAIAEDEASAVKNDAFVSAASHKWP